MSGDGHPPGLVGVIASDTARFSAFAESLTALELPKGSDVVWRFGHSMPSQTNQLVEALLAQPDKEWLWILGDDHVFPPTLLTRLLDADAEIAVPLCLMRFPPYAPVIFSGFKEDGRHRERVDLSSYLGGETISVHSAGSAGMLVRRHVFEELERPWFEGYRISSEEMTEDVAFCDKARAAGIPTVCRLDAHLGHCVTGTIWPIKERGGWTHGIALSGGYLIRVPLRG